MFPELQRMFHKGIFLSQILLPPSQGQTTGTRFKLAMFCHRPPPEKLRLRDLPQIPFHLLLELKSEGGRDSPVQVVEEGEEVEGQLTPGLLLAVAQGVGIHDNWRVVG